MSRIVQLTTQENRTVSLSSNRSPVFPNPSPFSTWTNPMMLITGDLLSRITLSNHRVPPRIHHPDLSTLVLYREFEKFKDGTRSEPITMNSKYPSRINRHASRENKIKAAFLAVHDPNEFSQLLMEQFGSEIGTLEVTTASR
jgi:hypothetical protein